MPDQPYFSLVIPTYNRAAYIERAIRSVLGQSARNFELIVVDDGSTDNTDAVVSRIQDERLHYFKNENHERAAARNFGIQRSRGEYVTFLDSDDYLRPNHFEEAVTFVRNNPDALVFSLGYDVVDPDGTIIYPWKPLPDPVNTKLAEGNFLSCMGVFVRRDVILANLFNEDRDLSGSEDYELWIRLAARYPIRAISSSTACLVNHDSRSVISISVDKLIRRIALLKRYINENADVREYYGELLLKLNAYVEVYLALHLVIAKHKKLAVRTLCQAPLKHRAVIFNKRFWVVVKKVIFN